MSKPPPKAGITPTNSWAMVGRIPQTCAATAAWVSGPQTAQPNSLKVYKGKVATISVADKVNPVTTQPSNTAMTQPTPLQIVADMLIAINKNEKLDSSVKKDLENVIEFVREAEESENSRYKGRKKHDNVSTICQAVLADLVLRSKGLKDATCVGWFGDDWDCSVGCPPEAMIT